MNFKVLKKVLESQPKYRLEQAKKAVFVDLIESWDDATILPVELRERLNKECPLVISAEVFISRDKQTVKALISLQDGLEIESVLMRYEHDRNTVCVSSQIGCALKCDFCATGKTGFKRNLSVDEIVEQVLFWARWLKKNVSFRPALRPLRRSSSEASRTLRQGEQAQGENKITNLVFMGMGEPFLNYDNVLGAIRELNDPKGFNLGARHFSISTVGIVEGIKKLADEPLQINLAISLHAPNDKLRTKLIPINKKYPIKKILKVVDEYIKKTNRKVMFEYIMIDGINDSDECAKGLVGLMKKPLYFINLIPCNPVGNFKPSLQGKIERFKKILKDGGVQVNQRHSFGQDIKAACGQLTGVDGTGVI